MQTVLFHSTIFGPIRSRRLGVSLGVNLTPDDGKICTFDCLYCEAGFNAQGPGTTGFAPRERVARLLESRLRNMSEAGEPLDVITFSGNGEPTLHPDFGGVIDDTLRLRDRYYPSARVSVLSNSTRLDRHDVEEALRKVDNNILKLDSALTATMRAIDRPTQPSFTSEKAIDLLCRFKGQCIVQTMFLRGEYEGVRIDNTTPEEVVRPKKYANNKSMITTAPTVLKMIVFCFLVYLFHISNILFNSCLNLSCMEYYPTP